MIQRLLNRSLDGLFVQALIPARVRRLNGKVLCLVYHRVSDEPPGFLEWGGVPTITSRELRRDLAVLQACGARFLTLEDLRNGRAPAADAPNFIISFDDGFRDTYDNGLRVLDELGIRGVVFQVAELLDGVELNWEHLLYRYAHQPATRPPLREALERLRPGDASVSLDMQSFVKATRDSVPTSQVMMALDKIKLAMDDRAEREALAQRLYPRPRDLQAAREAGHEIGSHGLRHVARRFLDRNEFHRDVTQAKAFIGAAAGTAPEAYAYPFGCHRSDDVELLSAVHRQAVIASPGPLDTADPCALRRCLWPGPARSELRRRRWLLTGRI